MTAGAPSLAASEAAKAAGNEAVLAKDFEAAERHYSEALADLAAAWGDGVCGSRVFHATLLCNRAHVRQQRGLWQMAVEDATASLDVLLLDDDGSAAGAQRPDDRADVQRLRIKALFRRGLACEALGRHAEAHGDLNLALKLAPTNEGLASAARRVRQALPPGWLEAGAPRSPAWVPEHACGTRRVMELADAERFPGRLRGFTTLGSDPAVRFAGGVGVAAHHGHGALSAILRLGPPRLLPRTREREDTGKVVAVQGPPELGDAYFSAPNFVPADGLRAKYGREGDLRWICRYRGGELDGLALRFEPEGLLRREDCGLYRGGRLVEKWQDCLLPEGYIGHVLSEAVIPVKKALGIDLSPCEQRLCYENYVAVDSVAPAELGGPGDQEAPRRLCGRSTRPREWWLPQLQVADPSRKYDRGPGSGEFAPIGPGGAGEVCPFGGGFPYLEAGGSADSAEGLAVPAAEPAGL